MGGIFLQVGVKFVSLISPCARFMSDPFPPLPSPPPSLPSPPLPSVSSNYQVLMPQFLRAVRVLCALHKYYMGGVAMDALQYPLSSSVPASPSATASGPQGIYELYNSLYE